jgi:predicted RNase H-like nuclease (RuvC/YqgF family)
MWTDEQRQRYHVLSERDLANELTAAEAAELAALVQQLCDAEAACLAPANERKAQEMAASRAAVERLETQNSQLCQYLSERRDFLERVKSLVTRVQAEDQEMRERFAAILTSRDQPATRSSS